MLPLTAFLLCSVLDQPAPEQAASPADYAAMAKSLKAALPEGWGFVSARPATFVGHGPALCWLATLEANKEGDVTLVVEMKHDPANYPHGFDASKCEYFLSVGAAGTKRSVADPFAAPNCCVGDKLVVPIPVVRGDSNHRFSFTEVGKRHILAHQKGKRVIDQQDEKPKFQVEHPASDFLRLVSGSHNTFTFLRSQDGDFMHRQAVILEAVQPGKLQLRAPIEILPADAKLTAWVGSWYHTRITTATNGRTRGYEFAGSPQWTMRIGDRLQLEFTNGPAKAKDSPPPPLTIPMEKYAEAKEPFPIRR